MRDTITLLRAKGIQPTPQRIAVAESLLGAKTHPSADQVWEAVQKVCPTVSRATVYNTLNLLVEKGLARAQVLREGTVVFDPHVEAHHHFIDEESGKIYDIPWESVKVSGQDKLSGYEIHEYQVILRGKRKRG
jgi:Fur family transcriptional regulator, iron response regulator